MIIDWSKIEIHLLFEKHLSGDVSSTIKRRFHLLFEINIGWGNITTYNKLCILQVAYHSLLYLDMLKFTTRTRRILWKGEK